MICVSLGSPSVSECLKALRDIDFAEIRLDLMEAELSEIPALFSSGKRLIATCRPGKKSVKDRKEILLACLRSGAAFVDLEHDAEEATRISILKEARKTGSQVILSCHNLECTPSSSYLHGLIRRCFSFGADYVKVACRAASPSEAARLLGLLGHPQAKKRLIVVGLGPAGRAVRLFAPFLGSPFTYASLVPGAETAPGQFSLEIITGIFDQLKGILGE